MSIEAPAAIVTPSAETIPHRQLSAGPAGNQILADGNCDQKINTENRHQDHNKPRWSIHKAADALEAKADVFYPHLTPKVVDILRHEWAAQWDGLPEWRSLLDKTSLQQELEESIVAIALYMEYMSSTKNEHQRQQPHIVVDVCAGKGLFSFLLSFLCPFQSLQSIVMIEKAAINWYHIHVVNALKDDNRPRIHIWERTNLHQYDDVLSRLLVLPHSLVLSGIHLCKQLSPAFCGIVNGLGQKCLMACLAPCCLPRVVTGQKWTLKETTAKLPVSVVGESTIQPTLSIHMMEDPAARQARLDYMERRNRVKKKLSSSVHHLFPSNGINNNGSSGYCCFFCQDPHHAVRDCRLLQKLSKQEQIQICQAAHASSVPCWNCLEFGHYKSDCPVAVVRSNPQAQFPPLFTLDLSGILIVTEDKVKNSNGHSEDVLKDTSIKNPFERYCHLLSTSLQDRLVRVLDAPLEKLSVQHQDDRDWNKDRKSIFIVAGTYRGATTSSTTTAAAIERVK